jgi:MoaA/NifB/PqqE/SkfB family radical SAM enzyme
MPIRLLEQVLEDRQRSPLREVIPSTMGEPLLFPEFERLIDLCVQHGLLLNLTTNGTFPRLGAREWARRLVPVLSDVKVSWNGATPQTQERIMLGSSFPAMVENVRILLEERDRFERLSRHRARVTFQLTFLETNTPELPDIVRLAIRLGIDRVKGHHVWTHFPELEAQSMRRSPEAIARWNAAVREAQAVVEQERLPSGAFLLLENFHELAPDATSDLAPGSECPFLGKEAWVNAEGRFDPCCAPDLLRRELGSFGNLQKIPFEAIWSGDAYRRLLATHPQHPLCVSCNMRRPKEVRP